MTDIRIVSKASLVGVWTDWLLKDDGLLDESMELATAIMIALGTDGLAEVTDILPDLDSTDRRGWWGNLDAETIWDGWPIGSRLWLLSRAKITDSDASEGATLTRAENYAYEALQPFIQKRIARDIFVHAERTERERIELSITIVRGPMPDINLRFQMLWDELKGQ